MACACVQRRLPLPLFHADTMKRWIPWIAVAIVVAVVAAGALRAIAARKAQQQTASSARAERVVMDIAPGEVIALRARSLSRSLFLPLSLSRDVRFAEETVSWRPQEQYMQQLPWSSGRAPAVICRRSLVRSP